MRRGGCWRILARRSFRSICRSPCEEVVVTSPTRRIEVECPACGTRYEDDWRPSINLGLGEEWTPEEIEEATSATCPECGRRVALDALVVDGDVWRSPDRAGPGGRACSRSAAPGTSSRPTGRTRRSRRA